MSSTARIQPVTSAQLRSMRPVGDNLIQTLKQIGEDRSRAERQRTIARALTGHLFSFLVGREAVAEIERLKEDDVAVVCQRMADLGVTPTGTPAYLKTFFGRLRPRTPPRPKPVLAPWKRALILDDEPPALDVLPVQHGFGTWEHVATIRDLHPEMHMRYCAKALLLFAATARLSLACHFAVQEMDPRRAEGLVKMGRDANVSLADLRDMVERAATA